MFKLAVLGPIVTGGYRRRAAVRGLLSLAVLVTTEPPVLDLARDAWNSGRNPTSGPPTALTRLRCHVKRVGNLCKPGGKRRGVIPPGWLELPHGMNP